MRDDIAALAGDATGVADLKRKLDEWSRSLADDDRIASAIMQPAVIADLAGQMFVQNIELGGKTRLLADEQRPAFLRLPYQEALDFWIEQGGSQEMLDRVIASYRKRAADATQLMLDNLSRSVISRVEYAIEEGSTLRDFAAGVQADTELLGISPASSSYLETVFRTNVQTAYGAGRFRQLTSPNITAVRRWVQYRTAGDNRVRENHAALDGVIFEATSGDWHRIAPPCGFNCRCSFVSLDDEGMRDELSRGAKLSGDVSNIADLLRDGPDSDSFAGPPTEPIEA